MNTKLAAVGISVALAASLAALGGNGSAAAADCDPNAPGSCDAYAPDDPFVPGGNKVSKAPPKTVVYADFAIVPSTIVAAPGEKWTEDNRDVATHNLTKDGKKQKNGDVAPDVMAGQKATFTMPSKKGTYKVVCYYHQNMTATITIK